MVVYTDTREADREISENEKDGSHSSLASYGTLALVLTLEH